MADESAVDEDLGLHPCGFRPLAPSWEDEYLGDRLEPVSDHESASDGQRTPHAQMQREQCQLKLGSMHSYAHAEMSEAQKLAPRGQHKARAGRGRQVCVSV